MRSPRMTALAVAGALSLGLLAACGSSNDAGSSSSTPSTSAGGSSAADTSTSGGGDEQVTITVAGLLPTADDAAKQQLAERVTSFEAKYPNITVETQDYEWLASTFTTQLAGGTLPNVF